MKKRAKQRTRAKIAKPGKSHPRRPASQSLADLAKTDNRLLDATRQSGSSSASLAEISRQQLARETAGRRPVKSLARLDHPRDQTVEQLTSRSDRERSLSRASNPAERKTPAAAQSTGRKAEFLEPAIFSAAQESNLLRGPTVEASLGEVEKLRTAVHYRSANTTSPPRMTIHSSRDLGRLAKVARKRMKLSQQKFADLAGVGRRFVSELECGKPTLEFDRVIKVCSACGIDIFANLSFASLAPDESR